MTEKKIIVSRNGPYIINCGLKLKKEIIETDKNGFPYKWKDGEKYPDKKAFLLCRCGNSKNKPYCDSSHITTDFDGTETASRKKYIDQAEKISGPDLDLTDARELCSSARFCDRMGGIWKLTKNSHNPKFKKAAEEEACNCPSGRLIVWNKKTGKAIEPKLKQSLGLIEDPAAKSSGPIWARGGIEIESADGKKYEKRNQVTLCRCGKSRNKPFCDGMHIPYRFSDGDKSLK